MWRKQKKRPQEIFMSPFLPTQPLALNDDDEMNYELLELANVTYMRLATQLTTI